MKKYLALTLTIISIMCFIAVFNAKGVESYKLNHGYIQTNSGNTIAKNNINLEDIHTPKPDNIDEISTKPGGSDNEEARPIDLGGTVEQHNKNLPVEIEKKEKNRVIDLKKPMVALTFDDGPHPEYTKSILASLEKYNGLGTFFVLGSRAEKYKSVIKDITESGSQIGNHTYDHKELTKLGSKAITNEISKTDNILQNIANIKTSIVRPTYGSVNDKVKLYTGAPLILWSIDTLDWKTRNKEMIVKEVLGKVKDGDVILMHDIYKTTAMATEIIIKELNTRGYQLVTIDELYKARGIDLVKGKVYASAHVKK